MRNSLPLKTDPWREGVEAGEGAVGSSRVCAAHFARLITIINLRAA